MKILIPLAGGDGFFPREEFFFPKPLIEVAGKPMIEWAVENLRPLYDDPTFVFVIREDDARRFSLAASLKLLASDRAEIVTLRAPTQGAACSALMAVDHIDTDEPLVIANGDQIVDVDLPAIVQRFRARKLDAGVVTFPSVHPRWSYVRGEDGAVREAAEKRVLSKRAIAGLYYFARGKDFVDAAKRMILQREETDGLYYIAPSLNQLILQGRQVGYHDIEAEQYHSFYSPSRLQEFERTFQKDKRAPKKKRAPKVNIVIPMAGEGSRFAKAGYAKPKPFIDVGGKTMIERVLDNLETPNAKFILLARDAHLKAEPRLARDLERRRDAQFVSVDKLTEGAACTVLLARSAIDPDAPLLIANCDQIIDFDCARFVQDAQERGLDGSILVFKDKAKDPKWSFAKVNKDRFVTDVQEKKPISDLATVGIYYFARGRDFLNCALDMIARNERVNNEFYVAPVYNYAIAQGLKIGVFDIPAKAMHGIGTPDDLNTFLALRYSGAA